MKKYLKNYAYEIPKIGLGMAALGRPGYINLKHGDDLGKKYDEPSMYENTRKVLDAAWNAGLRYFDAARSYGKAEQFLKQWIQEKGIDNKEIVVASKWGYEYTANWQVEAEKHEIKDHSIAMLEKQWEESRQLLGQHLQCYQIHSAKLETGVLDDKAILQKLADLKSEGIKIGLTLSGPEQAQTLEKAMKIDVDGVHLFDSVQATYNLLERSAEPTLQEASKQGLVVVIKEALANGRLTTKNESVHFAKNKLPFFATARELDIPLDALAMGYVMQKPWVDIVLSGAVTIDQIHSNLKALDLKNTALPDSLDILAEPTEDYWNTRKSLAWN